MSYLIPAIPFALAAAAWVILLLIARPSQQRTVIERFTLALRKTERAIGAQLLPAIDKTNASMAQFNEAWKRANP